MTTTLDTHELCSRSVELAGYPVTIIRGMDVIHGRVADIVPLESGHDLRLLLSNMTGKIYYGPWIRESSGCMDVPDVEDIAENDAAIWIWARQVMARILLNNLHVTPPSPTR